MSDTHSTPALAPSKPAKRKPAKPFPDFPLFPHATNRWAKKIRGKLHYFGPWSDPDRALAKYNASKEALHAGRQPREVSAGVTVKDMCNRFLIAKRARLETGELAQRSWDDYKATCYRLVEAFGKGRLISDLESADFAKLRNKLAKKWGPVTLGNEIQRVRVVFNFAYKESMIPAPIRYGAGFERPSRKTLRKARAAKGPRMFEPEEIRAMVHGALVVGKNGPELAQAAGLPLKAMILLGVNCGFGNADCGLLPIAALDLAGSWLNYPRPKTGIDRRCWLWPETVAALRAWSEQRPEPKRAKTTSDVGLVFLTVRGDGWAKDTSDNPVSKEMRKLLDSLGINGHRNFYALRHTFETIGGEAKDQVAVDAIMGHADASMAAMYRERISDDRLKAVAEHVRAWLFGAAG